MVHDIYAVMARQFKLLGRQEHMNSQLRIAVSLLTFPNTNECIPSQLYFFFLDYSNGSSLERTGLRESVAICKMSIPKHLQNLYYVA